jgi:hypothetical protein
MLNLALVESKKDFSVLKDMKGNEKILLEGVILRNKHLTTRFKKGK